jgi:hypothetical protein
MVRKAKKMGAKENDHDLLIRLDENVRNLTTEIKKLGDDTLKRIGDLEETRVKHIDMDRAITEAANSIRVDMQNSATQQQKDIDRLGKIVYGACALVLVGFITALIALVYK